MTLEDLRRRYPAAETFRFGDGPELSALLLGLVRSGRKTGTCMAMRDVTEGREPMPRVGRRDIALDWDGAPALVIETVRVELVRFRDVDEAFALSEGENDDLSGWRADHQTYFERNGGFDPDMELVCERFRVVEDLAGATA